MNQRYISISDILFENNKELDIKDLTQLKFFLEEGVTGFIITEDFADVAHNAIQKMKGVGKSVVQSAAGSLQNKLQSKFGYNTGNQANNAPVAPFKPWQRAGNYLNSRGAVIRNSPMIQVVDPNGVAKYLVFPDLDLKRPGHKEVLSTILQNEPNAKLIPVNAPERRAAEQSGKGVTEIRPVQATANAKDKIQAALTNLNQIISKYNNQVNTYSFMSAAELEDLQKSIQQAIGTFNNSLPKPKQTEQAAETEMKQKIEKAPAAQATEPQVNQQQPAQDNVNVQQVSSDQSGQGTGQPVNVIQPQAASGFSGDVSGKVTVNPAFSGNGVSATPDNTQNMQGTYGNQQGQSGVGATKMPGQQVPQDQSGQNQQPVKVIRPQEQTGFSGEQGGKVTVNPAFSGKSGVGATKMPGQSFKLTVPSQTQSTGTNATPNATKKVKFNLPSSTIGK